MRKKDLFNLIQPLSLKCHSLALCLLPDDLQAQQLMIDSFTQCLLKEKSFWLEADWSQADKRDQIYFRKLMLKSWIKSLVELGVKRSTHVMANYDGEDFKTFYHLDIKTRAVAWMKFQENWTIPEIEKCLDLKRFEVIEKIHNARFILMGQPPHWMPSFQEGAV